MHSNSAPIVSILLRFLVCALIVVATSVLAALAWDQSDNAAASEPAARRLDARIDARATAGRLDADPSR